MTGKIRKVYIPLSELNRRNLDLIFEDANYYCPYCKQTFNGFKDLKEHLEICVSRKKALKYHPYPYSPINSQTKISEWV